jgi:hypothetical protein
MCKHICASRILWTSNIQCTIYKNQSFSFIIRQMDIVQNSQCYLFEINFNIIFPNMPKANHSGRDV